MDSFHDLLSVTSSDPSQVKVRSTPQLFINGFHCSGDEFDIVSPQHSSFGEVSLYLHARIYELFYYLCFEYLELSYAVRNHV